MWQNPVPMKSVIPLGLQHQSTYDSNCVKTAEYSPGQGSGEIGWAPIMGDGYYENLTTWHIGNQYSQLQHHTK